MRQIFLLRLNDGNRKETEQKEAVPSPRSHLSHARTHRNHMERLRLLSQMQTCSQTLAGFFLPSFQYLACARPQRRTVIKEKKKIIITIAGENVYVLQIVGYAADFLLLLFSLRNGVSTISECSPSLFLPHRRPSPPLTVVRYQRICYVP